MRIVPGSTVYHLGGGTLQTDSPSKVFYNHRNNLAMLYKCSSPLQRLIVAVVRPMLDLLAALSYLAEHYAEPVTVGQLAGYCNLSKSYFMGCFKRATGMSAMEHLCQLRIRAACEALGKTSRGVSEIAADCGFQNLSGFNRQFKKRVGCSPAQYRRSAARPPEGEGKG